MPSVHSLTPVAPHCSLICRDFGYRDIAILVANFMGLLPAKNWYGNPREDPTVLMARIYGLAPPELWTLWEYSTYLPCSSVRFNAHGNSWTLLREYQQSPPPGRFLWIAKCSSTSLPTCGANLWCFLNASSHNFPYTALQQFLKVLSFLSIFPTLNHSENLAHTPCGRHSTTSKCWILSTLRTSAIAVSKCFTQVHNPETPLGLRTPWTAPMPNCTLRKWEKN